MPKSNLTLAMIWPVRMYGSHSVLFLAMIGAAHFEVCLLRAETCRGVNDSMQLVRLGQPFEHHWIFAPPFRGRVVSVMARFAM
jgi:hypothetical protein